MSNLTSTVPAAFTAVYDLLAAAGAAQSPKVAVFNQELVQYEPGAYVILTGIENHHFDPAALGSFAFEESYDICGYVTYLQGNIDPATVLADTWALYQNVVMTPLVANRGTGGQAPLNLLTPSQVAWIIPGHAAYTSSPGDFGGGEAGFQGTVTFACTIRARITTP